MAESLQEYVIKLGTQIDNKGVQNILSLLDANRLKALGLTAALTAATTAVYKFVESTVKQEFELEALAKKQHKNIENVRAEQQALKSMGKTLQEIKKDAALEKTYKEIVELNKEMTLPNATRAMGKVRDLQGAFWKLHSAVNYAVQGIGKQLLINLEQPMERFSKTFGSITDWIQKNYTSVSNKIASYLTAFSKGIIGIVEGVQKIFTMIGQMPEGIRGIATTIGGVIALIKSGPIGQILALITAAGNFIHDYENWQWNKAHPEYINPETGQQGVEIRYAKLWEATEKMSGMKGTEIGTLFLKAFTRSINDIDIEALGESFATLINSLFTRMTETVTGLSGKSGGIFDALREAVEAFVTGFVSFISETTQRIDFAQIGDQIGTIVTWLLKSLQTGMENILGSMDKLLEANENGAEKNPLLDFITGFIKSISVGLEGLSADKVIDDAINIGTKLISLIGDGITEATKTLDVLTSTDEGKGGNLLLNIAKSLVESLKHGMDKLTSGEVLTEIGDIVNKLFNLIQTGLTNSIELIAGSENEAGEHKDGLLQYGSSLVTDIAGSLVKAIEQGMQVLPAEKVVGEVNSIISKLFSLIQQALNTGLETLFGSENEAGEHKDGLLDYATQFATDIVGYISEGAAALDISSVGPTIGTMINNIFTKIGEFLSNNAGDLATIVPDLFTAGTTLAGEILDSIVGGLNTFLTEKQESGKTGLETFIDGLFKSITTSIEELYNRITSDISDPKHIDLGTTFQGIGEKIADALTGAINIGTEFLSNFAQEALDWIANDGAVQLFNIGKAIVEGILKGTFGFFDRLFLNFLPEEQQEKVLETREAVDSAVEMFTDSKTGEFKERVTGKSGQEYTWDQMLQMLQENVKEARIELGLEEESQIDKYKRLFWKGMGGNNADANYDMGDIGALSFNQQLAQNFGMTYSDEGYLTHNGRTFVIDPSQYSEYATAIDSAESVEQFNAAIDKFAGYLDRIAGNTTSDDTKGTTDYKTRVQGAQAQVKKEIASAQSYADANPIKLSFGSNGFSVSPNFWWWNPQNEAMGGRFDSPTDARLGEAGPEYLIPIDKPGQSISLIAQALSEMGSDAINAIASRFGFDDASGKLYSALEGFSGKVSNDFSLGTAGTVGESFANMESAMQGMQNATYNINAPVNIYVQASGAGADEIGASVYNAAERQLLKTLRGAWA